jgi:hypothetical protein
MKLLAINADAKTIKGVAFGYLTGILYLAPEKTAGATNVCPYATAGCKASCLNTAGRGVYSHTQAGRIRKTLLLLSQRNLFVRHLADNIEALKRKAQRMGLTPCVRLNGTSDLIWSDVINQFPDVQFYDYTKSYVKAILPRPTNYHLTFSRSESNESICRALLAKGVCNVAVVFRNKKTIPSTYWGYKVVSGDESDLRFLDEKGVVVALKAKGKAKRDTTGFVVD